MSDGRDVRAFPHDWIVLASGAHVIVDVISPKQFEKKYALVVDGRLTLEPEQRTSLERALGEGSTTSAESLVTAVRKLAPLKIGNVEVVFTPQRWEEIVRRAEKRGVTPAKYMQQVIDHVLQEMWTAF